MNLLGLLTAKKTDPGLNEQAHAIISPNLPVRQAGLPTPKRTGGQASYTLTYSQFEVKISAYAKLLVKLGINNRSKVAILSENSIDYIILIFSLWQVGAVPVPLNIRLLPEEIEEIISFAGCNILFVGIEYDKLRSIPNITVHKINSLEEKTADLYEAIYNSKNFADVLNGDKINMNDTAVIIFTSGTSGKPKGVLLSFNNLINSALTGNKIFKHRDNDRWLASLPFYHIGGFSVITRNFFYRTSLIVPNSLNTEDLQFAIENQKPTFASLVTTQLHRLLRAECKPNPELRHVLLGGGFIDPQIVSEAIDKGWNVLKSYGTSETASFVIALTRDEFKIRPQSSGRAIAPNNISIINENKIPLPPNTTGEIVVKAQSVARGYLNNVIETKNKFAGSTFYTGDFGYLDEAGYLFVEARRKDLIISGGENINPYQIELEIKKYPGLSDAYVFGLEDKEWGHVAAAAIVSNDTKISVEIISEFLRDKLSPFKHPKKIFIVDELPKTELGKVLKDKLLSMLKSSGKI
jgi:O-succinylbenzoic acid--CoA ligase